MSRGPREKLKQILEKVEVSEDEFELAKSLISEVREELLSRINELKEKDWESGWNILSKLNKISYIDFTNIPRAFRYENLPKILANHINKLSMVNNLEEGSKIIGETLQLIERLGIKHIRLVQLLHLTHIIKPNLFIPVTNYPISLALCYIYSNNIAGLSTANLEECAGKLHSGHIRINNIYKIISELRNMAEEIELLRELQEDERIIKLSLILEKYGNSLREEMRKEQAKQTEHYP